MNSGSNQIAASFVNTILTVTKFKSLFLNLSNSCLCKEVVRNSHSIVKHVVYPLIIDSFVARAVMGLVRSSYARKLASEIKIKADSERLTQTSNLRLIMTLCLSLTISELIAFVCGPEMTSCRFVR